MSESGDNAKELVVFRNESGDLGFFQRDGDKVHYIVYPASGSTILTTDDISSWHTWSRLFAIGMEEGNPEQITPKAINYFLSRKALINPNVVQLHRIKYPGSYYPRIFRKNIEFNPFDPNFLQDMRAYQNIQSSLDNLFNFIEPVELNLKTYGHKIRELLILACTEVEYLLLKVLTENGYPEKGRYSTVDYVRCRDVLKLNLYEVELTQYSSLGIFTPFKDWDESRSTASIPWYYAYNQVKHNRSDNIPHANLKHLLDAVAAIHILLESQYGERIFQGLFGAPEYKSVFYTLTSPEWELDEITAPILKTEDKFYRVQAEWLNQRKYFEDHPY